MHSVKVSPYLAAEYTVPCAAPKVETATRLGTITSAMFPMTFLVAGYWWREDSRGMNNREVP